MNSSDLVKKARKYLHDEFADNNHCCEQHIVDWVEAVLVFRQKATNSCCINTLKSVQHFILSESSNGDYKARENSMFGDLNEVRNKYIYIKLVWFNLLHNYINKTLSTHFETLEFCINNYLKLEDIKRRLISFIKLNYQSNSI